MKITKEEKEAVDAQVLECIRTKRAVTAKSIGLAIEFPQWAATPNLRTRIVDRSLQRLKARREIWYHQYRLLWVAQGQKP